MKITLVFLLTLSSQAWAQSGHPASPVYSCLPNCTPHGCFLRCENRRPTYGESMRFPGLPSFESEEECREACTCKNYPIGPRLPNGEVSCQEWSHPD